MKATWRLKKSEARGVWIGVNDYRRRLESAGLTPAIAEVLALEQGDTDKLCEYSPRALLDLVFHVLARKRFSTTTARPKQEQREAERELKEMERTLEALNHRVEAMIGRANRYIEWQTLQRERVKLEQEVLPRLELSELQDSIMHARKHRTSATAACCAKTMAAGRPANPPGGNQIRRWNRPGRTWSQMPHPPERCQHRLHEIREDIRTLEAKLNERQRLQEIAAAAEGVNIAERAEELAQLRQQLADIKSEIRQRDYRIDELNTLVKALKGGQPPSQPFVEISAPARCSRHSPRNAHRHRRSQRSGLARRGRSDPRALSPYRAAEKPSDRAAARAPGEKLKYRPPWLPTTAIRHAPTRARCWKWCALPPMRRTG